MLALPFYFRSFLTVLVAEEPEVPFLPFLEVLLLLEPDFTAFLTSFSSLAMMRHRSFPDAFVT